MNESTRGNVLHNVIARLETTTRRYADTHAAWATRVGSIIGLQPEVVSMFSRAPLAVFEENAILLVRDN